VIEKYISYSRAIKQEESMVIVSDQKVCIYLLHVKKIYWGGGKSWQIRLHINL
jgi:hypothetical protein